MIKLEKPIKCKIEGKEIEINEIDISSKKFTPRQILEAEKEFLITGGIFPTGEMESSRAFLGTVASKMICCSFDDLVDTVTAEEFLQITNAVKGLFLNSGLENILAKILEKQS